MIGVTTRHPEYTTDRQDEWRLMRDAYAGESAIKRRTTIYLPKPDGWAQMKDGGTSAYTSYITRARFPEIVANAIRGMVGVMHGQEWQIDLPSGLEYLFEKATPDGLPLEVFARRVSTELLLTGRYGVLADAPESGGNPYLVGYGAEAIINWDEAGDFFVLSEIQNRRTEFAWQQVVNSRVLSIVEGRYQQQVYNDSTLLETMLPTARGGAALGFIPLAIGGAMDMDLKPDVPPLIGVARAAVAHYQLNADYRMALFMAYQDTLFIYNAAKTPSAIGAGVMVALTSAEVGKDVRAEYVAPSGSSIEAHERAMDREQAAAIKSGAQLFDNTPRGQESGEARRLRFSAETATLSTIAGSSAAILERALKYAAIIAGANENEVVVKPPQNMLDGKLDPQQLAALGAALDAGNISYQTYYENIQRGGIASMERDAEAEQALILAGDNGDDGETGDLLPAAPEV